MNVKQILFSGHKNSKPKRMPDERTLITGNRGTQRTSTPETSPHGQRPPMREVQQHSGIDIASGDSFSKKDPKDPIRSPVPVPESRRDSGTPEVFQAVPPPTYASVQRETEAAALSQQQVKLAEKMRELEIREGRVALAKDKMDFAFRNARIAAFEAQQELLRLYTLKEAAIPLVKSLTQEHAYSEYHINNKISILSQDNPGLNDPQELAKQVVQHMNQEVAARLDEFKTYFKRNPNHTTYGYTSSDSEEIKTLTKQLLKEAILEEGKGKQAENQHALSLIRKVLEANPYIKENGIILDVKKEVMELEGDRNKERKEIQKDLANNY